MAAAPKFEVVEEPDSVPEPQEASLAFSGLMLALSALSKRALVALEACFTLFTVILVWSLWYLTPDPTSTQIVSLAIFAVFILLANGLVLFRRKR
jgi:hypothetical protein